ncbi:MAG: PorP/SprF family type IX secretion system membrane protein [Bacteroidales bacterium]|nr:PorP/SprF family type IX secretion system membrane protein [Bacteroidales bacterium]
MSNKSLRIVFIFLSVFSNCNIGQEIPLLSPVYSNSFLYNPALAGGAFNTNGSFFVSNHRSFVNVNGHPVSNIFGAHMPIKKYNCGIGGNVFINRTNFLQTEYSSVAFAYHISFEKNKSLSFGLSSDLYHVGVDLEKVTNNNEILNDPDILKYMNGSWLINFSSGVNYQTEWYSVGGTMNNTRNVITSLSNNKMNSYYSAYFTCFIPVCLNRDIIQPMVIYRQLPYSSPLGNLGLLYSYKSKNSLDRFYDGYTMGGFFVNTNLQMSFLAGFKVAKRLQLTYNYESSGRYHRYIGASHEVTLIYNIIELSFSDRNNEYLTWYGRKLKLKRNLRNRK